MSYFESVNKTERSPPKQTYAQITRPGEVLAVLVKGDGHDAVGCVKGLFDAVTVVDIDIYVQNALMVSLCR